MSKLQQQVNEDFNTVANAIRQGIISGSASASLEDECSWQHGNVRCTTMVFERYSAMGGNRVSLNVTLFDAGLGVNVCGITSGGSQAMFWKINTFGEEAFLDKLANILAAL